MKFGPCWCRIPSANPMATPGPTLLTGLLLTAVWCYFWAPAQRTNWCRTQHARTTLNCEIFFDGLHGCKFFARYLLPYPASSHDFVLCDALKRYRSYFFSLFLTSRSKTTWDAIPSHGPADEPTTSLTCLTLGTRATKGSGSWSSNPELLEVRPSASKS